MKKEESDWILKLDIVEKGDKLQVGPSQTALSRITLIYERSPVLGAAF